MRPGKGRLQEAEDVQPLPPDCSVEPDPSPTPPADVEQPPAQGSEEEAVARELEQLYLSHLRRLRGEPDDNGAPPPRNGGLPFPERAPNTSLANEMALRYEAGVGRHSPPVLLGGGGPVEGALVVPARPPRGRGLGGALRGCGVVLALAVLVPVAWGDGGGPTAALALGLYLALAWLT
ncbi:filensin-like isoform X2 [Falco cherrug]|nr:filensin-like isoform X2 [Falco cherrug]